MVQVDPTKPHAYVDDERKVGRPCIWCGHSKRHKLHRAQSMSDAQLAQALAATGGDGGRVVEHAFEASTGPDGAHTCVCGRLKIDAIHTPRERPTGGTDALHDATRPHGPPPDPAPEDGADDALLSMVEELCEPDGEDSRYQKVLSTMAEQLNTWREYPPHIQRLHEKAWNALHDAAQALGRLEIAVARHHTREDHK